MTAPTGDQASSGAGSLGACLAKAVVTHTVTYFVMGLLASTLLDYRSFFTESALSSLMRPIDSRAVMMGPLVQPLRGLLFGIVAYVLRVPFFGKNGWLAMWLTFVAIGILGTFGPAPGSIEGLVYTVLPLHLHAYGLPEVILQSLLFSVIFFYWVTHPRNKALTWVMAVIFAVVVSLSLMGLLFGGGR
jgi:hypothetical protein